MHLIHLLHTNACYSFCTNSNCRNLHYVSLLARSVKSLCCLKCFTWSIISTVRGEIVRIISVPVSSNSRGREKHRVFPLPVPTSTMTSSPHRTACGTSSCHSNGRLWKIWSAFSTSFSTSISSGL